MHFTVYTDWSLLPQSANALFTSAEKTNIFLSRSWFETITLTLNDDQSLLLACVESENEVLAILPLKNTARNIAYALQHSYSPSYRLLIEEKNKPEIITCLAKGLSELPLNALSLEPVADNDPDLQLLQAAMHDAGYNCEQQFRSYNWILRLTESSFEHYFADRPSRLRSTIARKQRKLEREHNMQLRLYSGNEVPGKMSDYYAPYTASWKANEQYVELVNNIVARFSALGCTRLGVLYVDDKPIAAQLWFVHHGKASIFRLSYDQTWKQYSPGSILTGYIMKHVIDVDHVSEVDFLTGNEPYKQDWMSERRERVCWSYIRPAQQTSFLQRVINIFKG